MPIYAERKELLNFLQDAIRVQMEFHNNRKDLKESFCEIIYAMKQGMDDPVRVPNNIYIVIAGSLDGKNEKISTDQTLAFYKAITNLLDRVVPDEESDEEEEAEQITPPEKVVRGRKQKPASSEGKAFSMEAQSSLPTSQQMQKNMQCLTTDTNFDVGSTTQTCADPEFSLTKKSIEEIFKDAIPVVSKERAMQDIRFDPFYVTVWPLSGIANMNKSDRKQWRPISMFRDGSYWHVVLLMKKNKRLPQRVWAKYIKGGYASKTLDEILANWGGHFARDSDEVQNKMFEHFASAGWQHHMEAQSSEPKETTTLMDKQQVTNPQATDSTETVTFGDNTGKEEPGVLLDESVDIYKGTDPYPDQGLRQMLSREYVVANFNWAGTSTAGAQLQQVSFPGALFSVPQIKEKLDFFQFFRADTIVTLRLNGSQMHYGALQVAWIPHYKDGNTLNYEQSIYTLANLNTSILSPNTSTTVQIKIPYVAPSDYWNMKDDPSTTASGFFGIVFIHVLSPLRLTTDGTTPTLNVTVFAHFENPEPAGIAVRDVGSLTALLQAEAQLNLPPVFDENVQDKTKSPKETQNRKRLWLLESLASEGLFDLSILDNPDEKTEEALKTAVMSYLYLRKVRDEQSREEKPDLLKHVFKTLNPDVTQVKLSDHDSKLMEAQAAEPSSIQTKIAAGAWSAQDHALRLQALQETLEEDRRKLQDLELEMLVRKEAQRASLYLNPGPSSRVVPGVSADLMEAQSGRGRRQKTSGRRDRATTDDDQIDLEQDMKSELKTTSDKFAKNIKKSMTSVTRDVSNLAIGGFSDVLDMGLGFLMDKPIDVQAVTKIRPDSNSGLALGNGLDQVEQLGIVPNNLVVNDYKVYKESKDYNLFENYKMLPGLVLLGQFDASATVNSRVFVHPVTPTRTAWELAAGENRFYTTHISNLASFFGYWTGSMKYHILFFTSKFISGRVTMKWIPDPTYNAAITNADFGNSLGHTIDITGDTSYSFTIPWMQQKPWQKVPTPTVASDPSVSTWLGFNGQIALYITNPLVVGQVTGTASVGYALYCSGGPDFRVARPMELWTGYHDGSLAPSLMKKLLREKKEKDRKKNSKEEADDFHIVDRQSNSVIKRTSSSVKMVAQASGPSGGPSGVDSVTLSVNPRAIFEKPFPTLVPTTVTVRKDLTMGEEITSWQELARRYTRIEETEPSVANAYLIQRDDFLIDQTLAQAQFWQRINRTFHYRRGSLRYKVHAVRWDTSITAHLNMIARNDSNEDGLRMDLGYGAEGACTSDTQIKSFLEFQLPFYLDMEMACSTNYPEEIVNYPKMWTYVSPKQTNVAGPWAFIYEVWISVGDDWTWGWPSVPMPFGVAPAKPKKHEEDDSD